MTPVLLLWYFDNDIWFALLTDSADVDRAIALNGCRIPAGEVDADAVAWLEGLSIDLFRRDAVTELPPMALGARVVTLFGY
jgi:hypothetical protein